MSLVSSDDDDKRKAFKQASNSDSISSYIRICQINLFEKLCLPEKCINLYVKLTMYSKCPVIGSNLILLRGHICNGIGKNAVGRISTFF